MGTDPKKIEIVKSCLEGSFTAMRHTEESVALESRSLFNDQQQWSELKGSPSKIISVGSDGIGTRQPHEKQKSFGRVQITKGVRWVEINDLMFVILGATCVDVVGEP